jgi:hypothetical protein
MMSWSQVCNDLPLRIKMQFFAGPLLHVFAHALGDSLTF